MQHKKIAFAKRTIQGFCVLATSVMPLNALADDLNSQQISALKIIRETADDICYKVEQHGSENDKELSGQVQAKVAGAISRIADLNVSGNGQLKDSVYQGVVRDQLLPALTHSANCKNDVFHSLVEKMVPSLAKAVPVAPGLPPTNQLPAPTGVTMTETTSTIIFASNQQPIGRYKLQLYKCGLSDTNDNVTCLVAISYQAQTYENQYVDYTIDSGDSIGVARFIDNLNEQHSESSAYFINGKGQHKQTVNMEKDVPVWLALEFAGSFNDVISGRIIFKDGKAMLHVKVISKQSS